MFYLLCAAVVLAPQDAFDLRIKRLAEARGAFQAMRPTRYLDGDEAGTIFFFHAGRSDCRFPFGMSSRVLIKETIVGGKPKQVWSLTLKDQAVKGKPKPGQLNRYLWKEGLAPKGPVSKDMESDLSSPLPIAAYNSSGPVEILGCYLIVNGKLLEGEPADTAGAANRAKLRASYPITSFEIAWLKGH